MNGSATGRDAPAARSCADAAGPALITQLTERVEAAMVAGDWEEAAMLEHRRQEALVLLVENGGPELGAMLQAALAEAAEATYRLIGQALNHRRDVLRKSSTVRASRRAAEAYERNDM